MTATTRSQETSVGEPRLYVALELSAKAWKLAMTTGFGVKPWLQTVPWGALGQLDRVLARARQRFGLRTDAAVISCYEAGRDGFWIHRALVQRGIANRVVDSASIEVNRRARRVKTDRIDALKLVMMLVRVWSGERQVWTEVRVPSDAAEAARHVSRERQALLQERTRVINQMRGWLATWGTHLPARRSERWWTRVRTWAGAPLPPELQARLARASVRLAVVLEQVRTLEAQQRAVVQAAAPDSPLGRLVRLKAVATTSATTLLEEGLVWREFRNRRQVGGLLGFTPTPYQSGDRTQEQGIARAGNRRLQATTVQLAWQWVRWQRASPLTQWFEARFARGSGRLRRIGIVAVARRLLILLWRYATTGAVPTHALLKVA